MSATRPLGQPSRRPLVERDVTRRRRGRTGGWPTVRSHDRSRPVPEPLNPSLVTDGDTLPLQQLVRDTVDALDPALGVSLATVAAVQDELVAEDRLGGFVAPDFAPLAVSVFEQVAGRHDPRFRVRDGLYVGAGAVHLASRTMAYR